MRDFNRYSNGGGNRFEKRNSDRPSYNNSRSSGPKEMFPAVCDNCGKECEVPFRPSGNKPVFCSDCFEKQGGNDREKNYNRSSDSFERKDFRKPSYNREDNQDDWGKGNQERPHDGPPHHAPPHDGPREDIAALKQQLDAINSKLTLVLKVLDLKSGVINVPTAAVEVEVAKPKVKSETVVKKAAPKKKVKPSKV